MVDNDFVVNVKDYNKENKILEENNVEVSEIFSEDKLHDAKSDTSNYCNSNIKFTRNDFKKCIFD